MGKVTWRTPPSCTLATAPESLPSLSPHPAPPHPPHPIPLQTPLGPWSCPEGSSSSCRGLAQSPFWARAPTHLTAAADVSWQPVTPAPFSLGGREVPRTPRVGPWPVLTCPHSTLQSPWPPYMPPPWSFGPRVQVSGKFPTSLLRVKFEVFPGRPCLTPFALLCSLVWFGQYLSPRSQL